MRGMVNLDYKLSHRPTQIHERDGYSRPQTVTSAYTKYMRGTVTLDYKLSHRPTQIHERDGNSRLQTVTSAYTNT